MAVRSVGCDDRQDLVLDLGLHIASARLLGPAVERCYGSRFPPPLRVMDNTHVACGTHALHAKAVARLSDNRAR